MLTVGGSLPIFPPFQQGMPMALNIKNRVAESLARDLADATGETITDAVIAALRLRLAAVLERAQRPGIMAEIEELQAFVRTQPERDTRPADEIIGYDAYGLPK